MGLLDPQTLGLLMAAGAGLEASGPSRTPVSMGQVMSRGLLGGLQGYQQGVQNDQRGQMFNAQMSHMKMQEDMQREQMEQQKLARQQALALQQARAGIFGDPGVSPQGALANGGGPTQANADMIRPGNPMALNPAGVANYLRMPGADPKLIDTMQNLGPEGKLAKLDPKDYTTDSFRQFMTGGGAASLVPVRKREAIEAMGADGSPETRFIDPYADNGPIAKPVRRESVNLGGVNAFVNPYTQTSPLTRTQSPDALLGASVTMRGQNMSDARAGQRFNFESLPGADGLTAKQRSELAGKSAEVSIGQRRDADSVLPMLDQASTLLDKAHGSGVGNLVGGAQNFLGVGTEKNTADAQLKVIAGALVSKMPKMSGPQSDKDVQLYREMAGQVGDASLPAAVRKGAMAEVRRLNEKYASPSVKATSGWTDL